MNRILFFIGVTIVGVIGVALTSGGSGNEAGFGHGPSFGTTSDANAKQVVDDNVVAYTTGNEELKRARKKARATLGRFTRKLEAGEPGTYTIKFPLTQQGETEHIWLQVEETIGNKFYGRLANTPTNGNRYRMGQSMGVSINHVEDWMIRAPDGIYGGYTARYMLENSQDENKAQILAQFVD